MEVKTDTIQNSFIFILFKVSYDALELKKDKYTSTSTQLNCDKKPSWTFVWLFSVYFAPYIQQESPGPDVWYKTQPWLCHSMLATLMFCFQSPIFWMFIEGIYLHAKVSTNIFNQPPPFSIYYFIGWGEIHYITI